jgi:hypothetical protein
MNSIQPRNPFRFDRLPTEQSFVNRVTEVQRIVTCITNGENLLVHGLRRMGKTSCLLRAARTAANTTGTICFVVDLARHSTLADVTEALLHHAIPALSSLGEKSAAWLASAVKGLVLRPIATGSLDASALGGPDMKLELSLELRSQGQAAHATALMEVLDALDALSAKRSKRVAIIIDEFTFLEKFGPDRVSWQLRSAMQRHQNLTYILSGSASHIIEQMHGQDGPFFGMFGRLHVGPIPDHEISEWIDQMVNSHSCSANGVGAECVRLAGPRTRDIIQLARRTFDLATRAGIADTTTVNEALSSLLEDSDSEFLSAWCELTTHQQSVLAAIAAGEGHTLFTDATRKRYGLGATASVSQTSRRLARSFGPRPDYRDPILTRVNTPNGIVHHFDNPYFLRWTARLRDSTAQ